MGQVQRPTFWRKIPFKIADFWGRFRPRLASGEKQRKGQIVMGFVAILSDFCRPDRATRPGPAGRPATQIERGRYHFCHAFAAPKSQIASAFKHLYLHMRFVIGYFVSREWRI